MPPSSLVRVQLMHELQDELARDVPPMYITNRGRGMKAGIVKVRHEWKDYLRKVNRTLKDVKGVEDCREVRETYRARWEQLKAEGPALILR